MTKTIKEDCSKVQKIDDMFSFYFLLLGVLDRVGLVDKKIYKKNTPSNASKNLF